MKMNTKCGDHLHINLALRKAASVSEKNDNKKYVILLNVSS